MIALIDGDILVYRVGFASQDVEVGYAVARMDKMIADICRALDTHEFELYLTSDDHSNFRYEIYPEYKANRKADKPKWYPELRAYLTQLETTTVVYGKEADDALADRQTDKIAELERDKSRNENDGRAESCICSIDKDLDQVPGEHYDFVKDVRYTTTVESGLRFFYYQLLRGDPTDNIQGIEGVGPVGAAKILAGLESTESVLFRAVRQKYQDTYKKRGDELMLLNGRLLKIGGNLWQFPESEDTNETNLQSEAEQLLLDLEAD